MNRISSRNARVAVLQAAILVFLVAVVPAVAQNSDSTATNTTTTLINPNDPLLKGSDLTSSPSNYAGMGQDIPVRKDAWTWYWNEKAHVDIDTQNQKVSGETMLSACFLRGSPTILSCRFGIVQWSTTL